MLSGLELALALAAFVAGLTGTWSPCGFSMIETIGPTGHDGGRRTTLTACATFALGALAGGVLTFATLSGLGAILHAGPLVGAAVAIVAAAGELRGVRIVPQVRRQVPEHWRRVMALRLAAGLYGVLLGLGFTTFVLTLAVWALFGITLALGDPMLGVVVGLAFGAGRLLPVVVLAPLAGSRRGERVCATMAERPAILRGFRLADATALGICALVLAAAPAGAATLIAKAASDPSAAGGALAYEGSGGTGVLRRAGADTLLPGTDPALGGAFVAWLSPGQITIASVATLAPTTTIPAAGVDAVTVSSTWVVWRARGADGADTLLAARLADPSRVARVAAARAPAQVGQPKLDGETVVFHAVSRGGRSRIVSVDLAKGIPRTLRRGRAGVMVSNPSLRAGRLLYVRTSSRTQELRLSRAGGGAERVLYRIAAPARRDRGYERGKQPHRRHYRPRNPPTRQRGETSTTLWTTTLTDTNAYFTRLRSKNGKTSGSVLRVGR